MIISLGRGVGVDRRLDGAIKDSYFLDFIVIFIWRDGRSVAEMLYLPYSGFIVDLSSVNKTYQYYST